MDRRSRALATASLTALLALLIQFLLGMGVNLFVKIPADHPGANPSGYFSGLVQSVGWAVSQGPLLLAAHAGFGLLLVLASASLIVQGAMTARPGLMVATVVGFLGTLGAGFNGGSFLNYNADISSMLMAAGFALASAGYSMALFLVMRRAPAPART